jgi:hypothetical protein
MIGDVLLYSNECKELCIIMSDVIGWLQAGPDRPRAQRAAKTLAGFMGVWGRFLGTTCLLH